MTDPSPESVRHLARELGRALSIVRQAIEDFDAETARPEDAPFPEDRPSTGEQMKRLNARLDSRLLTADEVAQLRDRIDRGLTYVQARDLIARIDRQLEERA